MEQQKSSKEMVELNDIGAIMCTGCNVANCIHKWAMRRNPRQLGGLGECYRWKELTANEQQRLFNEANKG